MFLGAAAEIRCCCCISNWHAKQVVVLEGFLGLDPRTKGTPHSLRFVGFSLAGRHLQCRGVVGEVHVRRQLARSIAYVF